MKELPPAHEGSALAREPCHQFDMRRVPELVHRRYALDFVTPVDQYPGVASEGRDVA